MLAQELRKPMIKTGVVNESKGNIKILNLLNEASDFKFVTRKWNTVNDQSNANYDVRNEIIYNIEY